MATQKLKNYICQLAHVANTALPNKRVTVLLIGSTGNGKSTLGNFLLDPSKQRGSTRPFAMAKSNMPETQVTQSKESVFTGPSVEALGYSSVHFTAIDTPGLNESNVADLQHMIGIVEKLEEVEEIAACILVIKFNAKIDRQYRSTVEYYSKLLPSLFEKNIFVVMTDFASDPRSVAVREDQGIDVEKVKENTRRELVDYAKLSFKNPIVFMLDCLPYGNDESSISSGVRNSIIMSCILNQSKWPTCRLQKPSIYWRLTARK